MKVYPEGSFTICNKCGAARTGNHIDECPICVLKREVLKDEVLVYCDNCNKYFNAKGMCQCGNSVRRDK